MGKRLKVLISAYACEPGKGSEPGVGWNWALQMARFHDVWVVTRANNREGIEAHCAQHSIKNPRFVFVDLPRPLLRLKKGLVGLSVYYLIWQVLAWRKCRPLVKAEGIELAHHVSLMSLPRGSFVPFLGIRSIIGPIGGLQITPCAALPVIRNRIWERLRTLMVRSLKYNPIVCAMGRRTSKLVLANGFNLEVLPQSLRKKLIVGIQLGTHEIAPLAQRPGKSDGAVTIHWSGRFVDHKGFEVLIRAMKWLHDNKPTELERMRFIATAAGPLENYYTTLLRLWQLDTHTDITGWLSQDKLQEVWKETDIFVFTSLRETTGMALQEAMMRGIPSVVIRNGGPAEMVTDTCGVRIDCVSLDQMASDLAASLLRLVSDPGLRVRMGAAAADRSRQLYSWEAVGNRMASVYEEVIAAS